MVLEIIINIIVIAAIFLLSAVPLYFAVKFLGGKTTLIKAAIVNFIGGIIISVFQSYRAFWGSIIAFVLLVWVYHEVFRLKWWKAFLVWLVQALIVILIYVIVGFILGLLGLGLLFFWLA